MELAGDEMGIGTGNTEVRVMTPPAGSRTPPTGIVEIIAPTPWLLGAASEHLAAHDPSADFPAFKEQSTGLWHWWRSRGVQFAAARLTIVDEIPLEDQVAGVYRELLDNLKGWQLYRIWNYVPAINSWQEGQENYRRFNQGRAIAFQAFPGDKGNASLPAASAVGATGSDLVVYALSGIALPLYFENPEQVPAYQYPEQYGSTPPSFARGSVVVMEGVRHGFISGTAAIKGHQSMATGDLPGQVKITLDNLRLMTVRLGFPGALQGEAAAGLSRFIRIYLRDPAQAETALTLLREGGLPLAEHEVSIVQADVCRAELDIEIEAKFTAPA